MKFPSKFQRNRKQLDLPSGKTRTTRRLSNPDPILSSWYRSTLCQLKKHPFGCFLTGGEGGI